MLVLLAEDEADLASTIIDYLQIEGIDCDYARDGRAALNLIDKHDYDVLLLDVNMPGANGFEVCEQLQAKRLSTPVLFLTARDSLDDKLTAFKLGAQDYLTKPFALPELVARIKVLVQHKRLPAQVFHLDTLTVDFGRLCASRDGVELTLSPSLWTLLQLLCESSPSPVKRELLERRLWPAQEVSDAMLKTLLFRLRKTIDANTEVKLLHTIKGLGIALKKNED